MKRSIEMLWFVVSLWLTGCCTPDDESHITIEHQLGPLAENNWVASAQIIAAYVDLPITDTQLKAKNHLINGDDCCGSQILNEVGLTFDEDSVALSWEELRHEIDCSKDPILFEYGRQGHGSSMLIITGYLRVASSRYLYVIDPSWKSGVAERLISWNDYQHPPAMKTHWHTWYNFSTK